MKAALVLSLLALSTSACGRRGPSPSAMPSSWVGTEHARRGAYMGGSQGEPLPRGMSPELVRDEAILTRSDAGGTCFAVKVRTVQGFDEPVDALTPRCVIDGTEADGSVANATMIVGEPLPYRTRVERVSAYGVGARGQSFGLSITEPESRELRVVERTGEVCCAIGGGRNVRLWMKNRRLGYLEGRLVFDWELRYPAAVTSITSARSR